jgi:Ran GTPase-activating protein (RanGAP) involved in mRNA processing and transport
MSNASLEVMEDLARRLGNVEKMVQLKLRSCKAGPRRMKMVAKELGQGLDQLTAICGSGNDMGSEGASALIDAIIQSNSPISTLELASNEFGPVAAAALASAIVFAEPQNPRPKARALGGRPKQPEQVPIVVHLVT